MEESLQLQIQRFEKLPSPTEFASQIESKNVPAVIQFLHHISSFSELSINAILSSRAYLFYISLLGRFLMDALRTGKLSSSGIRLMAASITCRLLCILLFENYYYYYYYYSLM
jgi:hypothetical protein